MDPLLLKWRTNRNEVPWSAATIEERCNSLLLFEPGTSWMYDMGADWANKMVERATGDSRNLHVKEDLGPSLPEEHNVLAGPESTHA